jgi:hypothetical protein
MRQAIVNRLVVFLTAVAAAACVLFALAVR